MIDFTHPNGNQSVTFYLQAFNKQQNQNGTIRLVVRDETKIDDVITSWPRRLRDGGEPPAAPHASVCKWCG